MNGVYWSHNPLILTILLTSWDIQSGVKKTPFTWDSLESSESTECSAYFLCLFRNGAILGPKTSSTDRGWNNPSYPFMWPFIGAACLSIYKWFRMGQQKSDKPGPIQKTHLPLPSYRPKRHPSKHLLLPSRLCEKKILVSINIDSAATILQVGLEHKTGGGFRCGPPMRWGKHVKQ